MIEPVQETEATTKDGKYTASWCFIGKKEQVEAWNQKIREGWMPKGVPASCRYKSCSLSGDDVINWKMSYHFEWDEPFFNGERIGWTQAELQK